jgi:hypothetical protein
MPSHPYLRAYMAGLVAHSVVVFLVGLAAAAVFGKIPAPAERAMIFPIAVNPTAWGLWNALHLRLPDRYRLSLGWHGVALCLVLMTAGVGLASALSISFVTIRGAVLVTAPTAAAYYVLWTHVVRFLNKVLDVSDSSTVSTGRKP